MLIKKNQKIWPRKFGKIHKNREKNLQFFGVKQTKIRWTVVKIKFIKGENFKQKIKKISLKIFERYIKIEKKICNFLM